VVDIAGLDSELWRTKSQWWTLQDWTVNYDERNHSGRPCRTAQWTVTERILTNLFFSDLRQATFYDSKAIETVERRISSAVSWVADRAQRALRTWHNEADIASLPCTTTRQYHSEFYREVLDAGDDDSALLFTRNEQLELLQSATQVYFDATLTYTENTLPTVVHRRYSSFTNC